MFIMLVCVSVSIVVHRTLRGGYSLCSMTCVATLHFETDMHVRI